MEQVAPRLANASKILTVLVAIGTAVNLKLDLLNNTGLSFEEYIGFGLASVLLVIGIISSRERKIPTLSNSPTLEQQLTAMEETPTKSNTTIIPNQMENLQTKNIIESIIGAKADINAQQIDSAIVTLSAGKLGQDAKMMAEQLPAPHRHADQVLDVPVLAVNQKIMETSTNVPLPSGNVDADTQQITPDLPDLPETAEIEDNSATKLSSISEIDSLLNEIPVPKNPITESLPDLSELDKFLGSENNDTSTPELPNLDDLF